MSTMNTGSMTKKMRFPFGIAKFPKLHKPDTAFNSAGIYSVDLVLDEKAKKELEDHLGKFIEEAKDNMMKARGLSSLAIDRGYIKEDTDLVRDETGDPKLDADGNKIQEKTGKYTIKIKTLAEFKDKKTGATISNKPLLVNKHNKPLEGFINHGAKIAVYGSVNSYLTNSKKLGITFKLKGVMLLDEQISKEESMFADIAVTDEGTDTQQELDL